MKKNELLLVLASALGFSPVGAKPLANGCAIESVAFTIEYLEKNPCEHASVLVLEPTFQAEAGHAVCVYGKGDLIYVHDLKLGDYLVGDERHILPDLRGAVSFRNRQILTARKKLGIVETNDPIDESAEAARALARLPQATRPIAITVAVHGIHEGVAFLFDRKLWIYLPKFGSTQVKLGETDEYSTAIERNLAANFPHSRLLRVGREN